MKVILKRDLNPILNYEFEIHFDIARVMKDDGEILSLSQSLLDNQTLARAKGNGEKVWLEIRD